MSVLKLVKATRVADVPAQLTADPWATAGEDRRRIATLREQLLQPLAALVQGGASINHAVRLFASQADAGLLDERAQRVLVQLGHARLVGAELMAEPVSQPTLKRWLSAYIAQGRVGLLPAHTGRVRKDYGWEARAIALYNAPSKPGFSAVARRLRQEGHDTATESRVTRYLQALPATLGEHSPARVGEHLHKLTRRHYQRRSVTELLVGEIYAGDGHTADCYVAHPNTGKPFRAELTVFIDIKSRYVVGWWLTESESAVSTLFALSHAMRKHRHVPAWVYIDRGAGYRAKMLSDESAGFYARFGIQTIGALPGNPHGKGWIERFFRTVRDHHDKFFAGGQVYCGDDMAEEVNRRLSADLAMGRRTLPSLAEYVESFRAFLDHYHREPMDVLGGRTPGQVWAELTPVGVEMADEAIARPSETRTVQRQAVRMHNRTYWHEALALYDAREVRVEYDLHDDQHAWIYDTKGRFVCQAKLVNTIGVLPTSRIDEGRQRRLDAQIQRLQRKADEAKARAQDAITAADQVRAIEDLTQPPGNVIDVTARELLPVTPAPASEPATDHGYDIDLLSWRDPE